MKIGIISSGTESLGLFSRLNKYDHHYLIYLDTQHAPYGEKLHTTSLAAVKKGINILSKQGAEKIIVPPVYELTLLQTETLSEEEKKLILPLFSQYLLQQVFPHSLVGKLGIFGDPEELQVAQTLINQLS